MTNASSRDGIEALLADAGWVRALVLGLVGDPHEAEDVVQEVWLQALRGLPRAVHGRASTRAWLGRVDSRLALRRRDRERSRRGREAAVSRPEAADYARDAEDRARLQRELADQVLGLDEPYRTAIVLRYWDGLSSQEIAERCGITSAAARKRVSRGLERIRARLDRRFGDRGAWCAALLALVRDRPLPAPAAPHVARLGWALAGLLGAGGLGVMFLGDGRPTPAVVTPDGAAGRLALEERLTPPREEPRAASPRDFAQAPRAPRARASWSGVVLDPTGEPVPGARVELRRPDRGAFWTSLREPALLASTRTDARGAFRLEGAFAEALDLLAAKPGYAGARERDRRPGEGFVLRLEPPAELRVEVLRAEDATPVAEARLRLIALHGDRSFRELGRGVTAADGRFDFDGLSSGRVLLEVVAPLEAGLRRTLDLEAGGRAGVRCLLPPADLVAGRVVDEASGAPVEGATVRACPAVTAPGTGLVLRPEALGRGWWCREEIPCRSDGTFEVLAGQVGRPSQVVARAPGYAPRAALVPGGPSGAPLELRLTRAVAFTGRVVDPDGRPVEGASVTILGRGFADGVEQADHARTRTDVRGCYELGGLRADLDHVLIVLAPGWGQVGRDLPPWRPGERSVSLPDVVLPPASSLGGLVLGPDGRPLADAVVRVSGTSRDRRCWLDVPVTGLEEVTTGLLVRSARCDDRGRFVVGDLAAGTYAVVESYPTSALDPVVVGLDEGEDRRDLRLGGAGLPAIAGVVLGADGRPAAGMRVQLQPEGGGPALDLLTDEAGRFRFLVDRQATYRLFTGTSALGGADAPAARALRAGLVAGREDLRVVLGAARRTAGVVVDSEGRPAPGIVVTAVSERGAVLDVARSDRAGRFAMDLPDAEGIRLRWDGAGGELEILAGDLDLRLVARLPLARDP